MSLVRLFLAAWLALFAVQATDLVAALAPDGCSESTAGLPSDPCDEACPRCVCCARVPAFIPVSPQPALTVVPTASPLLPPLDASSTPSPHGIFHVPKRSLT